MLSRALLACPAALLLVACGDNRAPGDPDAGPPPPTDAAFDATSVDARPGDVGWDRFVDGTVIALRPRGTGAIAIADQPTNVALFPARPHRVLLAVDAAGRRSVLYRPADGEALLDVAVHASGELTAVLADGYDTGVRLRRLSATGAVLDDTLFADPDLAADPFHDPPGAPQPIRQFPLFTHDTARVAAVADDLVLVLRASTSAVIASRFTRVAGGYQRAWRTLVEPGHDQIGTGITSGTCDVFGQIDNPFHVFVDADPDGNVYVASTASQRTFDAVAAFEWQFGTGAHRDPSWQGHGAIVSRIDRDGRRAWAAYVTALPLSEVHGVRFLRGNLYVVGRQRHTNDGVGWDGYLGRVEVALGAVGPTRTVDADRGDVLFDVAGLSGSRLVAVGASGYTQNTAGLSITEAPQSLLVAIDETTGAWTRIPVAAGPRHNEGRALLWTGSTLLVGGATDAPGTHSADGDLARLRADGTLSAVPQATALTW